MPKVTQTDGVYAIVLDRALKARLMLVSRALGHRGLADVIRALCVRWLDAVEKDPTLVADIARYQDWKGYYTGYDDPTLKGVVPKGTKELRMMGVTRGQAVEEDDAEDEDSGQGR